jgi:hypothetical protein
MISQHQNIGLALSQRRHYDRINAHYFIKISLKTTFVDSFLKIAVRGGYNPGVRCDCNATANSLELPILQHPQNFGLRK